MKHTINQTDIAIITTEKVEKTFDNVDAYLHGVIKIEKDDNATQTRTYKVRTDLVGYKDVEFIALDDNGDPKIDDDGQLEVDVKECLYWLEQKQEWSIQKFSYSEIDNFASQIASQVPDNLTRTQRDIAELQIMFLVMRQQSAPWGISGDKWRLRTNQDLIKDK